MAIKLLFAKALYQYTASDTYQNCIIYVPKRGTDISLAIFEAKTLAKRTNHPFIVPLEEPLLITAKGKESYPEDLKQKDIARVIARHEEDKTQSWHVIYNRVTTKPRPRKQSRAEQIMQRLREAETLRPGPAPRDTAVTIPDTEKEVFDVLRSFELDPGESNTNIMFIRKGQLSSQEQDALQHYFDEKEILWTCHALDNGRILLTFRKLDFDKFSKNFILYTASGAYDVPEKGV